MYGNDVRGSQNVCKGNRFENTRGAFNNVSARRARDVLVHIVYPKRYQYTERAASSHIVERASGHDLRHRKIVNRGISTPLTLLQLIFRKSGNVVLNNFNFYTRQNRYGHGKKRQAVNF